MWLKTLDAPPVPGLYSSSAAKVPPPRQTSRFYPKYYICLFVSVLSPAHLQSGWGGTRAPSLRTRRCSRNMFTSKITFAWKPSEAPCDPSQCHEIIFTFRSTPPHFSAQQFRIYLWIKIWKNKTEGHRPGRINEVPCQGLSDRFGLVMGHYRNHY